MVNDQHRVLTARDAYVSSRRLLAPVVAVRDLLQHGRVGYDRMPRIGLVLFSNTLSFRSPFPLLCLSFRSPLPPLVFSMLFH